MVLIRIEEITLIDVSNRTVGINVEADVICLDNYVFNICDLPLYLHTDETAHITVSGCLVVAIGVVVLEIKVLDVGGVILVVKACVCFVAGKSEELTAGNVIILVSCAICANAL